MSQVGVFEALADPVRRRILELLAGGERSAGELVEAVGKEFGISQSATSQQLRVLRTAALVTAEVAGNRRIYRLERSAIAAAETWLQGLASPWQQPLDALATEIARGRRERRRNPPLTGTAAG